jgi:hypothetical protein
MLGRNATFARTRDARPLGGGLGLGGLCARGTRVSVLASGRTSLFAFPRRLWRRLLRRHAPGREPALQGSKVCKV